MKRRMRKERPTMAVTQAPLVPPIRCTMPVPCGVCWYCKQWCDR